MFMLKQRNLSQLALVVSYTPRGDCFYAIVNVRYGTIVAFQGGYAVEELPSFAGVEMPVHGNI